MFGFPIVVSCAFDLHNMLTKSLVILYSLYSLYLLELCPYYLRAHIIPHTCAVVDHIQDSYFTTLTHSYNTSSPDVSASIATLKSISALHQSKFEWLKAPACRLGVILFGQFPASQRSKTIYKWLSVMCLSSP